MNLAVRDIRHSLGRFVLTCLGLALLLGVVLSMVGIYRGLVDDALVLVSTPDADVWVVEADTRGPFAEASRIPEEARDAIARLHGVQAAGSLTYQSVELARPDGKARLQVVGFEPGRPGGPDAIAAGRGLGGRRDELVADRRTGLDLGDTVVLGDDRFTVVGLTEGQVDSGGNPVAYMRLDDAQELQFALQGAIARGYASRGRTQSTRTVNAVVVRLAPHLEPAGFARQGTRWKHLTMLTQAEQEQLLLQSVVEKARQQIGLFTAILLAVSAVIIALIIYTMTLDKTREIATLKLIGAPDRTIAGLIVQQALAMGAVGFLLGAGLIRAVADYFPRRVILQPADGLALAAAVVVVCLAASVLGLRLALRIDAAKALGG